MTTNVFVRLVKWAVLSAALAAAPLTFAQTAPPPSSAPEETAEVVPPPGAAPATPSAPSVPSGSSMPSGEKQRELPPGYQKVSGAPSTEQVDANLLVVLSYASFFVLMFGYLIWIARKQAEIAQELKSIANRVSQRTQGSAS